MGLCVYTGCLKTQSGQNKQAPPADKAQQLDFYSWNVCCCLNNNKNAFKFCYLDTVTDSAEMFAWNFENVNGSIRTRKSPSVLCVCVCLAVGDFF